MTFSIYYYLIRIFAVSTLNWNACQFIINYKLTMAGGDNLWCFECSKATPGDVTMSAAVTTKYHPAAAV